MRTVLVGVLVVSASLCAATKPRAWQTGTVIETDHAREPEPVAAPSTNVTVVNVPPGGNPYPSAAAASAPNMTFHRRAATWQGFHLEGNGYRFMVMCPVRRNHTPNVTVNGPVKYAMEKGKFYLLDDDGKEWEMTVLEKLLLPAPVPLLLPK